MLKLRYGASLGQEIIMDTEILTSSGRPEASDPEVGFGFYRPASASGVAAETGHSQAFTTAAQTGLAVQEAQRGGRQRRLRGRRRNHHSARRARPRTSRIGDYGGRYLEGCKQTMSSGDPLYIFNKLRMNKQCMRLFDSFAR